MRSRSRLSGISQHGHEKLANHLETSLLQTECVRGLEPHTGFVASRATDFVRSDPEYDAGITGVMKIASMAEGFGLDVEFHAPGPVQRHWIAATCNTNYYELTLVNLDIDNPVPPYTSATTPIRPIPSMRTVRSKYIADPVSV